MSPSWSSQLSDSVLPSFASWFPNVFCEDEGRHRTHVRCPDGTLALSGRQGVAARVQLPGAC